MGLELDATVVICTWNRARLLEQTLAALAAMRDPPSGCWELILVNNNSTDATERVIREFRDRLPLRCLHESRPGKAHAANRALEHARGQLLVWTDDDVLPEPDWLASYVRASERWAGCAIFGGPIQPSFEGCPPAWLQAVMRYVPTAYGVRECGDAPLPLRPHYVPYGANFAVRTAVQKQFPFDPALGVRQGRRVGGYETEVIRKMLAAGYTGMWVPGARLRHCVRKETQTTRFLRHYYRAQGLFAPGTTPVQRSCPTLFGKPRWLWRQALTAEWRYRWQRLFCQPEVWIQSLVKSSRLWGELQRHSCPLNRQLQVGSAILPHPPNSSRRDAQ